MNKCIPEKYSRKRSLKTMKLIHSQSYHMTFKTGGEFKRRKKHPFLFSCSFKSCAYLLTLDSFEFGVSMLFCYQKKKKNESCCWRHSQMNAFLRHLTAVCHIHQMDPPCVPHTGRYATINTSNSSWFIEIDILSLKNLPLGSKAVSESRSSSSLYISSHIISDN